jgi:hypothetical protein
MVKFTHESPGQHKSFNKYIKKWQILETNKPW